MYARYKYRRYYYPYSKKYYLNKKFSPYLKKVNTPTYTQQVGRIIQTSPRRINTNKKEEKPGPDTLDKFYNILLKYGYNLPNPPDPPGPDIPPVFTRTYKFTTRELFENSDIHWFTSFDLNNVGLSLNVPALPDGYSYLFEVSNIVYFYDLNPGTSDGSIYELVVHNPHLFDAGSSHEITFFRKDETLQGELKHTNNFQFVPYRENIVKYERTRIVDNTFVGSYVQNGYQGADPDKYGYVPIMSSDSTQGTSFIQYQTAQTSARSTLTLQLVIVCIPYKNPT